MLNLSYCPPPSISEFDPVRQLSNNKYQEENLEFAFSNQRHDYHTFIACTFCVAVVDYVRLCVCVYKINETDADEVRIKEPLWFCLDVEADDLAGMKANQLTGAND